MIAKKSNPVPTTTSAKVQPADMLRQVIVSGKAVHTAALALVAASCGFLFLVNHFRDSNADGYMSRGDAIAYLKKQIATQANVKGGMLDIYVSRADTLYSKLVGSMKMFSPMIQKIGEADKAENIAGMLVSWLNDNWQIKSLSQLSEQLGYKTGRPGQANTGLLAEKVEERAVNAMKAMEKIVTDGDKKGHKIAESRVARAIVGQANKPLVFAIEAIKRVTEESELRAIETAISDHRKDLKTLAKRAQESVKSGKTVDAGTLSAALKSKAKGKGKATVTAA